MTSLPQHPTILTLCNSQRHSKTLKSSDHTIPIFTRTFYRKSIFCSRISCSNLPFESSPVKYSPNDDVADKFLTKTSNIFETLSSTKTNETPLATQSSPPVQPQYLKWPMWLAGPVLLLATGMAPTLWLPISSVFLGPNIASLLSLTGLDCIFNLGAYLFLLMADACARPKSANESCISKPPLSYKIWNLFATITGFFVPLVMLFMSEKGLFFQPQLAPISYAVLLGPYLLLLFVQIVTEMLIWHWKSPAWLVTPVIYEGYRILQLMRGIKLGIEISAPVWVLHTIKGLVCWWVLILCVQLMRVAWYTGFTARDRQLQVSVAD